MSSSATGVGMPICFLWAILLILTQKSSQKFGDVLGIIVLRLTPHCGALHFYLWKSRTFQNLFYPAIYKVASGL